MGLILEKTVLKSVAYIAQLFQKKLQKPSEIKKSRKCLFTFVNKKWDIKLSSNWEKNEHRILSV